MTPLQIIDANNAITELTNVPLPYKTARKLAGLQRRLREELDTVQRMEASLVEACGGHTSGGKVVFSTLDARAEYRKRFEAMMHDEADIELEPVDISSYADELRISSGAVNALDGLILFERAADNGG